MAAVGYMNISIIGDTTGVQAMLSHLQNKLLSTSMAAFLASQVDPYLRARTIDRFDQEGDDVVGQWLPLRDSTEKLRVSKGFPAAHPINDRTGEMRRYATMTPSSVLPTGLGASLEYPGHAASGELAKKVQTAQEGSRNPITEPRPIFGVNATDLTAVLTMLANEIATP